MADSRRSFLKKAGAGIAGFTLLPRHVFGAMGGDKRFVAPSDQLTRGIIGVGGIGMSSIVHIATPSHWHAIQAVEAARAGKDIFCEKPMTRTIGEGQKVVEAVARYGRIFRLDTWFRFKDTFYGLGTTVEPLKKLVDSGLLGWPLTVRISGATGFTWKFFWTGKENLVPQPVPKELDYDMWLGPAPFKPYHPHRVHQTFRGYWDYESGGLGDMGQHYIDPVQYILGRRSSIRTPWASGAASPTPMPTAARSSSKARVSKARARCLISRARRGRYTRVLNARSRTCGTSSTPCPTRHPGTRISWSA